MSTITELTQRFHSVWPLLDERTRRIMAANEAISLGYGGVALVRRACGLSRKAIVKGMHEIERSVAPPQGRIRRPGAGRKPLTASGLRLLKALEGMIGGETRGDPESLPCDGFAKASGPLPVSFAGKSTRSAMRKLPGFFMHWTSLQSNRKTQEGADHPDRDAQFRHINTAVKRCLAQGVPVI